MREESEATRAPAALVARDNSILNTTQLITKQKTKRYMNMISVPAPGRADTAHVIMNKINQLSK